MGVLLGLLAGLCWGTVDVIAAKASRRAGSFRVVLGFQVSAALFLLALALGTGALDEVEGGDLPLFLLLGALGWGGYVAVFRALSIGPISIVSPIASGYAAVAALLAIVLLGERPSALEAAAVVVAFAGVALASADTRRIGRIRPDQRRAVVLAMTGMLLFGGYILGIAETSNELGWLAPIVLARGISAVLVAANAAVIGELRLPGRGVVTAVVAGAGVVDTLGYVAFNVGARETDTAIVATASAPYAIVPVVAGVLLFRERPTRSQWSGVALVIAGVLLLGLASAS